MRRFEKRLLFDKIKSIEAVIYFRNGTKLKGWMKDLDFLSKPGYITFELEDSNRIKITSNTIAAVFLIECSEVIKIIDNIDAIEGKKCLILKVPKKDTSLKRIELFRKAKIKKDPADFITFIPNKNRSNTRLIIAHNSKVDEIDPVNI